MWFFLSRFPKINHYRCKKFLFQRILKNSKSIALTILSVCLLFLWLVAAVSLISSLSLPSRLYNMYHTVSSNTMNTFVFVLFTISYNTISTFIFVLYLLCKTLWNFISTRMEHDCHDHIGLWNRFDWIGISFRENPSNRSTLYIDSSSST